MKKLTSEKKVQKHIKKMAKRYYKDCGDILSFYGAVAVMRHGKSESEVARRYKVELIGLIKKIDEATDSMMRNEW